jgi:hypothetical protein
LLACPVAAVLLVVYRCFWLVVAFGLLWLLACCGFWLVVAFGLLWLGWVLGLLMLSARDAVPADLPAVSAGWASALRQLAGDLVLFGVYAGVVALSVWFCWFAVVRLVAAFVRAF